MFCAKPPRPLMASFYELLGVDPAASVAEIDRAYRPLVLRWHPDKLPRESSVEAKKESEAMTVKLNWAMEVALQA